MDARSEQQPVTELPQKTWIKPFQHYDAIPRPAHALAVKAVLCNVEGMGKVDILAINVPMDEVTDPGLPPIFYFNGFEQKALRPTKEAVER